MAKTNPARITKNRLTNTSFIIHLGQYQILPKEMIDKRHIGQQQNPRYIAGQWIMPGGKTINLEDIIQMAARQNKTIMVKSVNANIT